MPSPTTRQRILDAALSLFLEQGYESTTIVKIRERSGVSNGALFHHFSTKEELADALFVESMASFQDGLWGLLSRRPRTLRSAVRGVIGHQLRWIATNPERARFLYLRGQLDWDSPAGAQVAALNRDLAGAFEAWMEPLVERGEIRAMSMLVITSVVSGPTHSIAQRWLAGQLAAPLESFADDLIEAACAALGESAPRRRRPADRPEKGVVELRLLGRDGRVLAHGQSTTELVRQ